MTGWDWMKYLIFGGGVLFGGWTRIRIRMGGMHMDLYIPLIYNN